MAPAAENAHCAPQLPWSLIDETAPLVRQSQLAGGVDVVGVLPTGSAGRLELVILKLPVFSLCGIKEQWGLCHR